MHARLVVVRNYCFADARRLQARGFLDYTCEPRGRAHIPSLTFASAVVERFSESTDDLAGCLLIILPEY